MKKILLLIFMFFFCISNIFAQEDTNNQVQENNTNITTNQNEQQTTNTPETQQQAEVTTQPELNKPVPSVDPNSDIYVRGKVEKVEKEKKKSNKIIFVVLGILIVYAIISWPKISESLTEFKSIISDNIGK